MCDAYVCLANSSKDGSVIFGKNSDRTYTESQLITYAPRKKYSKGEELVCTHITIPQVSETAEVLLSQPHFMFGAEMGANEYDVVIGNEAVITREKLEDIGLLGMDLLRLGLERGKTAKKALDIIINLLEEFGQGGAHSLTGKNYHNSFIIADPLEAFILETAGKWWIVEYVRDFRSISNDLSIRGKGDTRKKGLVQHAIENGYCKDDDDFDFALTFSSPQALPSYIDCSMSQLSNNKNGITPAIMMDFLREHDGNICRHKRNDMTASSQVSDLRKGKPKSIHWFTGSILSCLSIYKPYVFPVRNLKVFEARTYSEVNPDWFWKKHAEFIKSFIRNPMKQNYERDSYIKKLRKIEKDLILKVEEVVTQENAISEEESVNRIASINSDAWNKSIEMIN